MAIPVTYYYIDAYLSTLRHLEAMNIETLYSGHWPIMRGDEVSDFLADSRHTVERLDRRITRALRINPSGLTLKQLVSEAREEFPEWPLETADLAMFSIRGHLDKLEAKGQVHLDAGGSPSRWLLN